tara:strand:+ start:162 stop:491 length:330 start_codon:yes stop_codon:yes gene_type:complete
MGTYTSISIQVQFKDDTPQEVLDNITYHLSGEGDEPWDYIFTYTGNDGLVEFKNNRLTAITYCKDAWNDYIEFMEYIDPYIEGQEGTPLGWMQEDGDGDQPEFIYKQDT